MATEHASQYARSPHATNRVRIAQPPKGSQEDEAWLIRQVAEHDHCAFEVLYQRYTPRLMSFLMRYLGCAALCEEVLHEVLLIVWEQAASFHATTAVSTWIFGIARHKALQARTAEAKRQRAAIPTLSAWRTEDIPETNVLQQMQACALEQALLRLPSDQRTALTLVYYQGCSYRETAVRTGYPVSTVRSQVRYARRRLATLLAEAQS